MSQDQHPTASVTGEAGLREQAIRRAAILLFQERGYEATTMRDLGQVVGIEAPSIYNHFRSKAELLVRILLGAMEDLLAFLRERVEEAGDDPVAQLRAMVTAYVEFHEERLEDAAITDSERRSLPPTEALRLLELRAELANLVREIVDRGVASGVFRTTDPSIATLCILSTCARLPVWYRPDGRLTLPEIGERIVDFTMHGVGEGPR